MTREEILKRAQRESSERKMDEMEHSQFDRSFYWAFMAAMGMMLVISMIKLYREESLNDIAATVFTAAFGASVYRAAKWKKLSYAVIALINLSCAVLAVVQFISGK